MTASAIRVLVIDDDFRVADMHREIVAERHGFEALTPVRSLSQARTAIRAQRPDLVLIDVYLPDGDGIEFLRTVDVDAFVLSAAADSHSVRRSLRAGALVHLIKPFDRRDLGERLDRYARFRNLLAHERSVLQDELDRARLILAGGDTSPPARTATEQLILRVLDAEEASASEIAERAGISRATAQRYLATLVARDMIDLRLRYGATGRPQHRYAARS